MPRNVRSLNAITDFVRRNPHTSAIAAFNLGLYAAAVARRGVRSRELAELPARLVGLVPSMRDLISLLGEEDEAQRPHSNRSTYRRKAGMQRATGDRARGTRNGRER